MVQSLTFDTPLIMGILNVTPDSFSDGGAFVNIANAVQHAEIMVSEGASIIDIGGESTRPGAAPVSVQEELDRVIPVIEKLKGIDAIISIDTYHAQTMSEALKAGALMINDVTGLTREEDSLKAAKGAEYICLMHMKGKPQSMQENPHYNNVVDDVYDFLNARVNACIDAGITKEKLIIDPGIGFGKDIDHNLLLLKNIGRLHDLDAPILLGTSRKSFIEKICGEMPADERLGGSIASVLWGLQQGVQIFRVHDVAQTKQAIDVYQAISDKAV